MNYTARCNSCIYGTRAMVFDSRLFKNDRDTPLSITIQRATIIDERKDKLGRRIFDVVFDYRPEDVSRGHFANTVRILL
jgi:hypothetical protein